ncbi:hypothetical protein MMC08_007991 [Hypocenomyce scalaris]|nr:hypothetical protein [Hypocenomyce scalaris]
MNQQPAQQGTAAPANQEDYADKGLDWAEKKFGHGKINPEQQRSTNEKITDGARGMFEKMTGRFDTLVTNLKIKETSRPTPVHIKK